MIGQNIGKYRVLDRVGRGGMGTVYRAIDETLHREVAIKVLNAELNDPEVARRFRAEAITVARLSHPGIATIYELFQHEGQWLMVMEFVRGETLEHMVDRTGGITPQRSAELCMQSLAALAHAHSMGVVHRDLKPANLMITETGSIKIMDFGIARVSGTEHLTSAGFMMGTPAYMAPEQVMGNEIDARADLYSLGVVFYRLTTAKLPFKGDTPFAMAQSQVNDAPTPIGMFRSDLPPWVEQVVVKALAKVPEERFQSAIEFHEALARCLAGLPMLTSYSSSAPTELMTTPPRAMPTGGYYRPLTSPGYPMPAAPPTAPMTSPVAAGTLGGGASTSLPAPGTGPGTGNGQMAPPLAISPPATVQGPAPTSGTAATSPTSGAPVVPAPLVQPPPAIRRTSTGLILAAAAAIVVLASVGGWWALSGNRAGVGVEPAVGIPAPPVESAPPTETPAVPPAPAPAADPPPPVVAPAASPNAAPSPGRARAAAPPPPASGTPSTSGTRGTAPETVAPAPGRSASAGRGTASDDSPAEVQDVKVLLVDGRKTKDQDVRLNFGGGQIALTGPRGGTPLTTLPYKSVVHATYVRARDPKWNDAAHAPPKDLDVGTFMRTSKHWLVLQSKDAYLILRLEDKNIANVLQIVEARTGLAIDRPKSTDKDH